jgi:hypothetical protein
MDDVLTFDVLSLDATGADVSAGGGVPPGESSPLFGASPSSLASGLTGGDEFNASVASLICIEEPRVLCCGVIAGSSGRRFCTRVGCGFKAHKTQKVQVTGNTLYVKGRKDQARIEPSLPISKLPADVTIEFIVAQEKAIAVWTTYFLSLVAKQNREVTFGASPMTGDASGAEEIDTPSLDQFAKVDRDFQTPRKLRLSDLLAADADTLPMPLKKPEDIRDFPVPENKSAKPLEYGAAQRLGVQTVLAEWHKVLENFDLLFAEIGSMGVGEKK